MRKARNAFTALHCFFISCVAILLLTATAKIVSVLHQVPVLFLYDPVFPFLTIKALVLATAVVETSVAGLVLWCKDNVLKLTLTGVLGSWFLLYRAALYVGTGAFTNMRCPCLGYVGDWLRLTPEAESLASFLMMGYLLIGSALGLFLLNNPSVSSGA
jgi:hypothetical protein